MTSEEQQFRLVLEQFYHQATKHHHIKYALKNKLKALFNSVRKDWLLIPETGGSPALSKTGSGSSNQKGSEKNVPEFSSLRLTGSKSRSNLQQHTLSVSRSRSKLSKSKDSSRDMSQNQSKIFNTQWVYLSSESSHTLLFGIMSAIIMTDNKFSFKYYEDKINDELAESQQFSELELSVIGNYWQKMGGLLAKSKIIRWQKMLKESIDKFPPKFTQLACKIILQLSQISKDDLLSGSILEKLAKQLKIQLISFTISYSDIEQITRLGRSGPQIYIGCLSHSQRYVIATKIPEYSKEELALRSIRNSFNVVTTALLRDLNSNSLKQFKQIAGSKQQKKSIAADHFKVKLVGILNQ